MSLKAALETLGSGPCYHMIEIFEHPEHAGFWQAAWRGEPQQIEALPRWDRNPNTGEDQTRYAQRSPGRGSSTTPSDRATSR